jgi:NhaP-type Na+/H+ or K+/H+ antiporter
VTLLAIFVLLLFLYSLISARLERTPVTAPIVFTSAGALTSVVLPDLADRGWGHDVFLRVAETGLVLLLFTDASRTGVRLLGRLRALPVRLLTTGLLLTILLGGLGALVVLRGLSLWEAGILAAILAPTDAGLGQVIVSSPRVPLKIRQALNVEAGLNDGLCVPFLLFFIALAERSAGDHPVRLTRFIVEQLGYGTLVGLAIGLVGGALLGLAHRRRWMAGSWQQLSVVMLPLLCALSSHAVHTSLFIAAFVAGLAVQAGFGEAATHSVEFTEEWGQLLNLSVFFLFGLLVAQRWHQLEAKHLVYGALSLSLVRLVPVALALVGSGLSRASVLFVGWFGPRGLASIVLGLVYLEEVAHPPGEPTIQLAVIATVLMSIVAHGLSAMPGIGLYSRSVRALPPDAPELEADPSLPAGHEPASVQGAADA